MKIILKALYLSFLLPIFLNTGLFGQKSVPDTILTQSLDSFNFLVIKHNPEFGNCIKTFNRGIEAKVMRFGNPVREILEFALFHGDKLIVVFNNGAQILYGIFIWNKVGKWDTLRTGMVYAQPGFLTEPPPYKIVAIDYNKIIVYQGTKKTLVEYSMDTRTETRTEIKE